MSSERFFYPIGVIAREYAPPTGVAFPTVLVAEEFIAGSEHVVAIGRIEGATRKARVPIDIAFVHVWTVGDGRLQRLRAFTDTAVLARALAKD